MCTSRLMTGRRSVFWSTTKASAATGSPTKKHQRQPTGVDEHAADERAADGGEGEDRADVAGVPAALARG